MKTFFVEARSTERFFLPEKLVKSLPKKVMLFTTVQFIDNLPSWKADLEKHDIKVLLKKPGHSQYEGQILGCAIEKYGDSFDAFLYVGDGLFHPKALMLKNDKQVFIFNPVSKNFFELKKEDIKEIEKKKKIGLVKFYSSKKIGVLISLKAGQYKLGQALRLKDKYENKEFYYLLDDTFNFNSLEDFNFLECYVNTACPRIGYDDSIRLTKPIVDISEIE